MLVKFDRSNPGMGAGSTARICCERWCPGELFPTPPCGCHVDGHVRKQRTFGVDHTCTYPNGVAILRVNTQLDSKHTHTLDGGLDNKNTTGCEPCPGVSP